MSRAIFFIGFMNAWHLVAGLSFEKPAENAAKTSEHIISDTTKAISKNDLTGIHTRLRVEGASFRQFNLHFAPVKVVVGSSQAQKNLALQIRQIIDNDLRIVGGFNFVSTADKIDNEALAKQKGAEGTTRLSITFNGELLNAVLDHKNLITGKKGFKTISGSSKNLRAFSHLIAQNIYEEFIGAEDIFTLQIAATRRDAAGVQQIVLMDFDGNNETRLTEGPWIKSSPFFTPDGKSLLYTAITPQGQAIVEQVVGGKTYKFLVKKPGLNIDARIFPDNSGMLATLSFEGEANVYRLSRTGSIVGKITSGSGSNLSASINRHRNEIAYVSSQSGTPQIYVKSLLPNSVATRLTFQGRYNQTPHFSADGSLIAFTGRDEKRVFDIFLIDRASGRISRVTENQGRNQEPFISPSGRFVIFISERDGRANIYLSTLQGDHQVRLTNATNDRMSQGYGTPVIRPKQK